MKAKRADSEWYAGDLFGEIYQSEITPEKRPTTVFELAPGLFLCGLR